MIFTSSIKMKFVCFYPDSPLIPAWLLADLTQLQRGEQSMSAAVLHDGILPLSDPLLSLAYQLSGQLTRHEV